MPSESLALRPEIASNTFYPALNLHLSPQNTAIRGFSEEYTDQIISLLKLQIQKVFTPDDLLLMLGALKEKRAKSWDYEFKIVESEGLVIGFACYTKVASSKKSYQLYWLAVHPSAQGMGIGKKLLEEVESDIRKKGGKLIILETSTNPAYSAAGHLYEKAGYKVAAKVDGLYTEEEDYLMYKKELY